MFASEKKKCEAGVDSVPSVSTHSTIWWSFLGEKNKHGLHRVVECTVYNVLTFSPPNWGMHNKNAQRVEND